MGKPGIQYLFILAALNVVLSPALYCVETNPILTASTVAILDITKRNKESGVEPIALRHSFEIMGISFIVTEDPGEAEKYGLIFTAGSLFNTTLSVKEVQSLYDYVETGGTLVSALVSGNRFFSLFGIDKPVDSRKRFEIDFADPSLDESLRYLDRKEEKEISLGNKKLFREIVWTHSFDVTDAIALGKTEDNKVIFSVNEFGNGTTYALGIGYGDAILLPHMGGDYEAQRLWINGFEPGSDVFVLILKAICEKTFETFVYKSTIPFGHKTALLLSHDVDAQPSFANSVDFAALEKEFGVRSTFFITTKYFADETDIGYYNDGRAGYIKKVKELGGDIGSHSVSHSKKFDSFAMGESNVNRAGYKPLTKPTVFGEVKVSKEILDRDLPNQDTIIFRAGELRVPESLFEVLEKSGYLFDSSFSAGDNMTNFAYRLLERKNIGARESPVIEIPVTFDDSMGLLRADNADKMVGTWLDVVWANADNEAISTLLIHPSETGYKLKAEEKLLSALKGKDIWIGDVTSYADFWKKRLSCDYDVYVEKDKLIIRLNDETLSSQIAFVVKYPARIKTAEVRNRNGQKIDFLDFVRGDKIFLWKKP